MLLSSSRLYHPSALVHDARGGHGLPLQRHVSTVRAGAVSHRVTTPPVAEVYVRLSILGIPSSRWRAPKLSCVVVRNEVPGSTGMKKTYKESYASPDALLVTRRRPTPG